MYAACAMGTLQIAGVSSAGRVSRWVAAHEELTLLARRRAELDGLEGPALLRALRAGVHRHLGLASFAEYVERLFGYSRRARDRRTRRKLPNSVIRCASKSARRRSLPVARR